MVHIIIATDSRGRSLPDFIEKRDPFPSNWKITIIFVLGGKISFIKTQILECINKIQTTEQYVCVMLAAGICNLTVKTNNVISFFDQNNEKTSQLISDLDD